MFSHAMTPRSEHQNNPRENSDGRVSAIGGSIAAFALGSPILVDGNRVIAGAVRLRAACNLGLHAVPVVEICSFRKSHAN